MSKTQLSKLSAHCCEINVLVLSLQMPSLGNRNHPQKSKHYFIPDYPSVGPIWALSPHFCWKMDYAPAGSNATAQLTMWTNTASLLEPHKIISLKPGFPDEHGIILYSRGKRRTRISLTSYRLMLLWRIYITRFFINTIKSKPLCCYFFLM